MAIITGGLHGRARGNVNGIIYGAARTRFGKVVTAREYVIPSYSRTTLQAYQRVAFKCALYATRYLAAGLWQDDFNRAIGQLPGFQSMMSIIIEATDRETRIMTPPPDTPLGNLYCPIFTCVTHVTIPGGITITWSDALGLNGTDEDVINVFGIAKVGTEEGIRSSLNFEETATRVDASLDIVTGASGEHWVVGCYFQGAGTAVGKLSVVKWYAVQSNPPNG
ncbi:unnamed protein product [marine sediment metagenome]|uniref:Uncharacterized protein n=1 Tax=marine sediment metagenome TaxID=412755 RepID=X1JGA6_9ZZZZ